MEAVILETKGKWSKIVTNDGYTGYIKTSALKNITTKIIIVRDSTISIFRFILRIFKLLI